MSTHIALITALRDGFGIGLMLPDALPAGASRQPLLARRPEPTGFARLPARNEQAELMEVAVVAAGTGEHVRAALHQPRDLAFHLSDDACSPISLGFVGLVGLMPPMYDTGRRTQRALKLMEL